MWHGLDNRNTFIDFFKKNPLLKHKILTMGFSEWAENFKSYKIFSLFSVRIPSLEICDQKSEHFIAAKLIKGKEQRHLRHFYFSIYLTTGV